MDVQDYFKQALLSQTHHGSMAAVSQTLEDVSRAGVQSSSSSETAELATIRHVLDVELSFQPQLAATGNTLQWGIYGVHNPMVQSSVNFDQAGVGDGGEMVLDEFGLWPLEWFETTRILDGEIQCV
jgi:hypothetical protein